MKRPEKPRISGKDATLMVMETERYPPVQISSSDPSLDVAYFPVQSADLESFIQRGRQSEAYA